MKAFYALCLMPHGSPRYTLDRIEDRELIGYTEAGDVIRFCVTDWTDESSMHLHMDREKFDKLVGDMIDCWGLDGPAAKTVTRPGPKKPVE